MTEYVQVEPQLLNLTCDDVSTTITCIAQSVLDPQYQWKTGDTPLNHTDPRYTVTDNVLEIDDVHSLNHVKYTCEVFNETHEIGRATATLFHPAECLGEVKDESSLPDWAIPIIVIAVLLVLGIVAGFLVYFYRRKQKSGSTKQCDAPEASQLDNTRNENLAKTGDVYAEVNKKQKARGKHGPAAGGPIPSAPHVEYSRVRQESGEEVRGVVATSVGDPLKGIEPDEKSENPATHLHMSHDLTEELSPQQATSD